MGLFFFKNATVGGKWILQERLDNGEFVKYVLVWPISVDEEQRVAYLCVVCVRARGVGWQYPTHLVS